MKICEYVKPELDMFLAECNFTEDRGVSANASNVKRRRVVYSTLF